MGAGPVAPPTVVEIDRTAFAHNVRIIRACLSPSCALMAVMKANAYGHGAAPLAAVALQQGAAVLAVARCEEGVGLRQAGITAPILVLGPLWPETAAMLVSHRLQSVVCSAEDAACLQAEAKRQGCVYPIHMKIDTGMRRLGLTPAQVPAFIGRFAMWTHLRIEGVMTHLATADTADCQAVQAQLLTFVQVVGMLARRGITPRHIHAANSAALFRYPESHWSLVRPGIALYGSHPFAAPAAAALRPVLTWKTRLARIQAVPAGCGISYGYTFVTRRQSVIGTLPVGYADGLCRGLSDVGEVLVHGQRAALVGRICMDMCMVDLTDIPHVRVGDEVVLIGAQGNDCITADEMAARCGRISYEVFCAIGPRVPRYYV
jgi:alanine racemase